MAGFRAGCPAFLVASALELMTGTHGISLSSDPMAEIVFSPAKPVDGGVLVGFLGLPKPSTIDQVASFRHSFPPSSKLKCEVKMSLGMISSESSSCGYRWLPPLCVFTPFSCCAYLCPLSYQAIIR